MCELFLALHPDSECVDALIQLSKEEELAEEFTQGLALFVCKMYSTKLVSASSLSLLRQKLYCKNLGETDKLPPTSAAHLQHILRAHLQAVIWRKACIPMIPYIDPSTHGRYMENEFYYSVSSLLKPAPDELLELVKCSGQKNCASSRCTCKRHEMPCTELCACDD